MDLSGADRTYCTQICQSINIFCQSEIRRFDGDLQALTEEHVANKPPGFGHGLADRRAALGVKLSRVLPISPMTPAESVAGTCPTVRSACRVNESLA